MKETPQQYIKRILGNVKGKNPIKVQRETAKKLQKVTKSLSKKQMKQRPSSDQWSIAEILAHLADAELVGGWRMRSILGNNGTALQAYDQDAWAKTFVYANRDAKESLKVFRTVRESNLALLQSLPPKLWGNYGMHAERGKETIAHIVRMFAGHDLNHFRQVEKIARAYRK